MWRIYHAAPANAFPQDIDIFGLRIFPYPQKQKRRLLLQESAAPRAISSDFQRG
jgi:hypothetical protein